MDISLYLDCITVKYGITIYYYIREIQQLINILDYKLNKLYENIKPLFKQSLIIRIKIYYHIMTNIKVNYSYK